MSWFDNEEAIRLAGASPELRATREDEPNFMNVTGPDTRLPFVIASEIEIRL